MSIKRSNAPRIIRRRPHGTGRSTKASLGRRLQFRWASAIPAAEWSIYVRAMSALRAAAVPFMLGGGFAFAAYTGRWRDTKDIDFYVRPDDREKAVQVLDQEGFNDYYRRLPYDRKWIYRSIRSDFIVDVIWAMANQRAQVDDLWFQRAPTVAIRGQKLFVIPLEELIWCKLYIVQRDRCDWTDILNLLFARGAHLDWRHLLYRLQDDRPLLQALLIVYRWICPRSAFQLPRWLWHACPPRPLNAATALKRSRFLDSRAWFAPMLTANRKLEI